MYKYALLIAVFVSFVASAPRALAVTYATFDPATASASVSLSGANLVVAGTGNTGWTVTRSTVGISSGTAYWLIAVTSDHDPLSFGISDSSVNPDSDPNGTLHNWSYYSNGTFYHNGAGTSCGASFTTGDEMEFALDMDAGTLKVYKNTVYQCTAVTGLTGTIYASAGVYTETGFQSTITANFGPGTSPPGGYNDGLYDSGGGGGGGGTGTSTTAYNCVKNASSSDCLVQVVDNPNLDFFLGWMLFLTGFFGIVWMFKGRH